MLLHLPIWSHQSVLLGSPLYACIIYVYHMHYPGCDITSQQDAGAAFARVLRGTASPSAATLVPAARYKQACSDGFLAKSL